VALIEFGYSLGRELSVQEYRNGHVRVSVSLRQNWHATCFKIDQFFN
jgi:hypothetical protein